ncbi:MAG: hypothetical protein ACE5DX_03155 [Candidatus Dojkabacteria bacterium]
MLEVSQGFCDSGDNALHGEETLATVDEQMLSPEFIQTRNAILIHVNALASARKGNS